MKGEELTVESQKLKVNTKTGDKAKNYAEFAEAAEVTEKRKTEERIGPLRSE